MNKMMLIKFLSLNRDGGAEDEITAGNITVNEEILKDAHENKGR